METDIKKMFTTYLDEENEPPIFSFSTVFEKTLRLKSLENSEKLGKKKKRWEIMETLET